VAIFLGVNFSERRKAEVQLRRIIPPKLSEKVRGIRIAGPQGTQTSLFGPFWPR
jgi:hypothetical protein